MLDVRTEADAPAAPPGAPLLEWKLNGSNGEISAKLYSLDQEYRYWVSDTGWYRIDPASLTIRIPERADETFREHRLWGVPTLLCSMINGGDFFLHAAAAEVGHGAILLAAPGRHGKTTLALQFHREGYRVLSEDSACCRLTPSPALLAGPAMLRIRPDMFDGRAPAGTHVVSVSDDRIYLALDEDRRGNDHPVPIRAIFFLRESAEEIHFERVTPQKALPDLWALNFRLPTVADSARAFVQLSRLAGSVPIWNLYRPLRVASLSKTVGRIVKILPSPSRLEQTTTARPNLDVTDG